MTWILILWINTGWQVEGTGGAGTGLATASFADRDACGEAGKAAHEGFKSIGYVCVPSKS